MFDECEHDHVHGGENGGFGAVVEVGVFGRGAAYVVFGREGSLSVASSVVSQGGCTRTFYKPR